MIVESHWRKIKHDYLHRCNRPRIDLVAWVLTSHVIPHAIDRMKSIVNGKHRKGAAAWRKAFKRQWDNLQKIEVEPQELETCHTSPSKWTRTCSNFLLSRFFNCEHIIACYENISDRSRFFSKVRRQGDSPFWTEDQLLLRPEYRVSNTSMFLGNGDNVTENSSKIDSEFSEDNAVDFQDEGEEDHDLEDGDDNTIQPDFEEGISTMKEITALLEDQKIIGNFKFLEVYLKHKSNLECNQILIDEINQRKRQRAMSETWSRNKHPATMYYK